LITLLRVMRIGSRLILPGSSPVMQAAVPSNSPVPRK
jgi:hypothetical protein